VTNALGHITTFQDYNIGGDARKTIDANGVVTDRTYDGLRRTLTTILRGVSGCDTALDPLCATDLTVNGRSSCNNYADLRFTQSSADGNVF
jgi:hypothetical protein